MSVNFIDSNVFIYLFDETDRRKQLIAKNLIHGALSNMDAVISFQVVQEVMNVITRKMALPVTHQHALQFLEKTLMPLWGVNPSHSLYMRGLELQHSYSFSFYDSLIVAAALETGSATLQSEDMQHGQQVEGLVIENPFLL